MKNEIVILPISSGKFIACAVEGKEVNVMVKIKFSASTHIQISNEITSRYKIISKMILIIYHLFSW
jgi:hypothetical protein